MRPLGHRIAPTGVDQDPPGGRVHDLIGFDQHLTLIAEQVAVAVVGFDRPDFVGLTLISGPLVRERTRLDEHGGIPNRVQDIGNDQLDGMYPGLETNRFGRKDVRKPVVTDHVCEQPTVTEIVVVIVLGVAGIGSQRISAVDVVDRDGDVSTGDQGDVFPVKEERKSVVNQFDKLIVLFRGEHELEEQIAALRHEVELQRGGVPGYFPAGEAELRVQIRVALPRGKTAAAVAEVGRLGVHDVAGGQENPGVDSVGPEPG